MLRGHREMAYRWTTVNVDRNNLALSLNKVHQPSLADVLNRSLAEKRNPMNLTPPETIVYSLSEPRALSSVTPPPGALESPFGSVRTWRPTGN